MLWVLRTLESAALLGLGLTTATGRMGLLFMTVQLPVETESHMSSVHRLQHFGLAPKERSVVFPGASLLGEV